ncbi:MarR family winged helix-turn-helix transcriptional regulator [Companilactobacillus hulinensis]|uniref:MarR family winged helix-turn-helix transcriptional regulator n=1 Tax=Companilactobacillus hulinensis TaxID=2486007 RepID=UPI000F7B0BA0|nr:winged helix DNA-binding protein [Companilactobacillus hulinensis]
MLNNNQISLIRKFNRQYTNTLGLMNKQVFNTDLSFPEARILMAIRYETTPMNVANTLNLDASYTSRVLKKLTKLDYIKKTASITDARSKNISLTDKGKKLLVLIDKDSDVQIQNLIGNLNQVQQEELYAAFNKINNILFENNGD